MMYIKGRRNEPKRLIVVRFIVVILIILGLLTIATIQILKVVNSGSIHQSSETTGQIPVPTVLLYEDNGALRNASIEVLADVYNDTTVIFDKNLTKSLKRLRYGDDIIVWSEYNLLTATNAMQRPIWSLQPPSNWQFTPTGRNYDFETSESKNLTRTSIRITAQDNELSKDIRSNNNFFYITFVESPEVFYNAQKARKPYDVMRLNKNLSVRVNWGSRRTIYFRHYQTKSKGEYTTKYELESELEDYLPNSMLITLMPQNGFTPDHQAFVYEVINVKESFTWTDSYGLIGGSFTISLYLFTLFFGQRRLRPWGIIQRFIFRNRVLRKFPSSVVEIDRPPTPKKTTEFERDSVIDPTDILPQLEAQNTMHTQQSQARDGLNTTPHSLATINASMARLNQPASTNEATLAEEVTQLKTLMHSLFTVISSSNAHTGNSNTSGNADTRIRDLEAFRQRVETFYLADDIFTKRGESSDNKRSTLQTISELNW